MPLSVKIGRFRQDEPAGKVGLVGSAAEAEATTQTVGIIATVQKV